MKPTLLHIDDLPLVGALHFHAYPAMLALAFLVCTLLAARDGEKLVKPPIFIPPQGAIWALVGALLGARIFHQIQYKPVGEWYRAIFLWESGLVFYGGLLGGLAATAGYLYATRNITLRHFDVVVPYLALGQAITRVGCFLNGCCWGQPCQLPWGVTFPQGSYAYRQQLNAGLIPLGIDQPLPVHPTQLYMTISLVGVCLLLRGLLKRYPFPLSVTMAYCFLYGLVRFTVEIYRGDSAVSVFDMMTVSQTISLALAVFGAVGYYVLERRHLSRPAPALAVSSG